MPDQTEGVAPRGIEGLVFEADFVSISWEEWSSRFPLVLAPDGNELWDYGDRASEGLLDAQNPACIWTLHHDSGGGHGDYIQNGRWRVNRLGYYITSIPVPDGFQVQVYDDPWPEEVLEFMRREVSAWQELVGVEEGSVILDEFEDWFREKHPTRYEMDEDYYALLGGRLELSLCENRAEYDEYLKDE